MSSFTFTREIAAPAETVFEVLTDHRGYAGITRVRRAELEREGEPAPNGVGAIRKLVAVGPPLREEVVAYEAPSRFSYALISGAPVRDHLGTVELTEDGGRTRMVYVVRAQATVPLLGPVVIAVVKQAVKSLVEGIVKESERRAATAG